MTIRVPLVDIAAQQKEVAAELGPALERVLSDGSFIGGDDVGQFETAYASYLGIRHCIGVGNGTDGLEVALRAAGVTPGAHVVLPANSFIATAEAVIRMGAVPTFVDVDDDYLLIDPAAVASAMRPNTQAVIPVHLFGQAAPVERIASAIEGTSAVMVEDAAQCQGARRNGASAGTFGVAAATSFYPGKNLGAAGDAGAVLTNDDGIARKARLLANHGSERKYEHEIIGFNSRMDVLQAVVLQAKLARLESWNEARRRAAAQYDALLSDFVDVRLPKVLAGNDHVWHLYVIRIPRRDAVMRYLLDRGIGSAIHYPVPIHKTRAFADLSRTYAPVAEHAAGEILSLPLHPHLTEDDQSKVADILREALARP